MLFGLQLREDVSRALNAKLENPAFEVCALDVQLLLHPGAARDVHIRQQRKCNCSAQRSVREKYRRWKRSKKRRQPLRRALPCRRYETIDADWCSGTCMTYVNAQLMRRSTFEADDRGGETGGQLTITFLGWSTTGCH